MVEKEMQVELQDNFYRDSFGKVIFLIIGICVCIFALAFTAIYLYLNKPPPITFPVGEDMRVVSPVPLNQPYLSTPDLLQWVADVLPKSFVFDFNNYNSQLKVIAEHFTENGWKLFLNQLNIYANYNNVQAYKLFMKGSPAAAPIILREGVIQESGKYGWWVQMPVTITYDGFKPPVNKLLTLQILIVRVPTLNNLMGVGIENVIQAPVPKLGTGDQGAVDNR